MNARLKHRFFLLIYCIISNPPHLCDLIECQACTTGSLESHNSLLPGKK